MAEKRKYWLHRITGGENGTILSVPLLRDHNLLSIGWSFISTHDVAVDIQRRGIDAIRETYSREGASWSRNAYSLLNFVKKMRDNDIVVVPMGAYINIYRLVGDDILTNDNIPSEYLEKSHVIKQSDGLYTTDGQFIDLGFYRKVEPVALNILRDKTAQDLHKKTKVLSTNLNITDVSKSIEELLLESDIRDRTILRSTAINELLIKNYKNIESLHLTDLRLVNLIVGKNNVGKSNVLEAISLYINNWSLDSLLNILNKRKEKTDDFLKATFNQSEDMQLNNFAPILPNRDTNFLKRNSNNEIVIGGNNHYLHFALMNAYYRIDSGTVANRLYQLTPYTNRISKISSNSEFVLSVLDKDNNNSTASIEKNDVSLTTRQLFRLTKSGLDYTNNTDGEIHPSQLINCKSLSTDLAQQLWGEFSLTSKEQDILNALKLINDQIEDFNFVNIDGRIIPLVKILKETDGRQQYIRMPLSELGDGLVHVLNIVVALISCQDGVLLIDEAESGLHYTTQMKLWQMIFDLAARYNVQIFATTHSNDCVNAFAKNARSNQAIMFRLNKSKNGIVAMPFSEMNRIDFALDNNIDLR